MTKNTQQQRDTSRKQILLSELASEKQALSTAKVAYDEGAEKPETFKNANGSTSRNVAKYEEKMKKLQDIVNMYQRNVNLLEKKLATFVSLHRTVKTLTAHAKVAYILLTHQVLITFNANI